MEDVRQGEGRGADAWMRERLLARFLRYVRVDTTSDRHSSRRPTTEGQLELARMLVGELADLGLREIDLDPAGFVFALLPSNLPAEGEKPPVIGWIAHLDTSDAAPGKDIRPRVHERYDGSVIRLEEGVELDPQEYPLLLRYRDETLITSDGRTLLGADDKAGLAEIMTALEYLQAHPEIPRGDIQVIVTPDEEQGLSMERIPIEKIRARSAYTLDGGEEGVIETECFEAYKAQVSFQGIVIHTGVARGKLVNAAEMAARFLAMIPQSESPQATDGRYGFYFPLEITGSPEKAELLLYLRDFREEEVLRRLKALEAIAAAIEAAHPGGRVQLDAQKQYSNLARYLESSPEVVTILEEAVRQAGLEPKREIVRGGTDGARLSELGIPTPNVFTGGQNFHSRKEWIALPAMVRAVRTAVHLARLWAGR
jgi:tripeptide aminopeptidase